MLVFFLFITLSILLNGYFICLYCFVFFAVFSFLFVGMGKVFVLLLSVGGRAPVVAPSSGDCCLGNENWEKFGSSKFDNLIGLDFVFMKILHLGAGIEITKFKKKNQQSWPSSAIFQVIVCSTAHVSEDEDSRLLVCVTLLQ